MPVATTFQGKVVSPTGTPLPAVQVVVHERITHARVEAMTGPDGLFNLELSPGVYDLGLDRAGDSQSATCFYGPLVNPSTASGIFVLQSAQGLPAGQVFGKIWRTPGVPAVNRSLTLRPGVRHSGRGPVPASQSSQTAGDGSFVFQLGSNEEISLDIEVSEETGGLDEWIDVAKRRKPCYVELAVEQSEVENLLRCNESELNDTPATPKPRTHNLSAGLTSAPDGVIRFESQVDDRDPEVLFAILIRGLLPVSKTVYNISDIAELSAFGFAWQAEGDLFRATSIKVDNNGSWWWKYAVNIFPKSSEAGSSYWTFTDQSPDSYALSVFRYARWHKVSYNSAAPNIQEINLTFDSGL